MEGATRSADIANRCTVEAVRRGIAHLERLDDQSRIVVNHYHRLMTPDPWFRGRVVIVGDAAHATTAHLASGEGMAIEDAVVLGHEVAGGGSVTDVLEGFMM